MEYAGKQIAVLGLGASGQAVAELLVGMGATVSVLDNGDRERLKERIRYLERLGVHVACGPQAAEASRGRFDRAVLSPGIDPSVPLVRNFVERRIEMIGELEFAYELCKCPVVAITGTNGKTTTTELVAAIFSGAGLQTVAAGNIGTAFAGVVGRSQDLDVVTLEVSSFQLEAIRSFRPRISAWLNFSPDHLDRYHSVEEYREAKLRIFENQTESDWAVVNFREELPALRAKRITFSAFVSGGDFDLREGVIHHCGQPVFSMSETALAGPHNAENIMAALAIGAAWGLSFREMVPAIRSYQPQAHRCERIRVLDGVAWINDSKATNLDSMEKALLSQEAPVILIAGGKDKGFEFGPVVELVAARARCAILIGEMAARIEAVWSGAVRCERAADLAQAVSIAREEARPGDVVLFSPGTSSFDMFRDYRERGDAFRKLVQEM